MLEYIERDSLDVPQSIIATSMSVLDIGFSTYSKCLYVRLLSPFIREEKNNDHSSLFYTVGFLEHISQERWQYP